MIRLGFAVRALGPGAPATAIGAHRATPQLSRWLVALYDILRYLARRRIRYYRLAAPEGLGTLALAAELTACAGALRELRRLITELGLRLSIHADHYVVLNSNDAGICSRSAALLEEYGLLLEALGCMEDGSIVVHASAEGGVDAALDRFARAYLGLREPLRRRVAVEHDEAGCSLGDLLALHERCGIAVVLDCLHLQLHNPERLRLAEALGLALATWPAGVPAEVHLSSPRTEGHLLAAQRGRARAVVAPRPGQHADFIAPGDAIALLEASQGLAPFDIMIEAKAGDLALLRLRDEIARLAPAWGSRLG